MQCSSEAWQVQSRPVVTHRRVYSLTNRSDDGVSERQATYGVQLPRVVHVGQAWTLSVSKSRAQTRQEALTEVQRATQHDCRFRVACSQQQRAHARSERKLLCHRGLECNSALGRCTSCSSRNDAPRQGCAIVPRPTVFGCCARVQSRGQKAGAALQRARSTARAPPRRLEAARPYAVPAASRGGPASPRERCAVQAARRQRRPANARLVSSCEGAEQQRTHESHKNATAAYDRRIVSAQPVVGACSASRS